MSRDDHGGHRSDHHHHQGLSSEVLVGSDNGLDQDCVIALDTLILVPMNLLGRPVGYLNAEQDAHLARAMVLAYDLEIPLLA